MFVRFDVFVLFFFFNDTATTEIYTLSLHDALPISASSSWAATERSPRRRTASSTKKPFEIGRAHSELQSHSDLVCRLLLEKKKTIKTTIHYTKTFNNDYDCASPVSD